MLGGGRELAATEKTRLGDMIILAVGGGKTRWLDG